MKFIGIKKYWFFSMIIFSENPERKNKKTSKKTMQNSKITKANIEEKKRRMRKMSAVYVEGEGVSVGGWGCVVVGANMIDSSHTYPHPKFFFICYFFPVDFFLIIDWTKYFFLSLVLLIVQKNFIFDISIILYSWFRYFPSLRFAPNPLWIISDE